MMRGALKTVDADTLTAEWNYRLKRYFVRYEISEKTGKLNIGKYGSMN